jgi:HemY protein
MLKFLVVILVLFALALGFHALNQVSGEAALTIGDTVYSVDLTTAVIASVALILVLVGVVWFVRAIFRAPWRIARSFRTRNRERAREAVSQGLVAIAAGDVRLAERSMLEATRRAPGQPLTRLLQAQTAQLKGDRVAAREVFKDMVEDQQTRIAGLRGLYIEAEREGEGAVAHRIAERARAEAPSAPWAARALLRHQTAGRDWDGALATLSGAADGRILDKRTARRQRAVILAAKAIDKEDGEPDVARASALEAHDLAPDLVPAAVLAGRLLARQGDIRRATRLLDATWRINPHPEIADAYLHVRAGDAASDRLKRAEALHRMRPLADEGRHAVCRAAIDARDFTRAREVMTPILTERPTRKALLLMAALEEAETGDRGRARGWMARAVHAPRDPAWTADGIVLEEWAPISPVSGKLDAVEWKIPVAEIEGPRIEIDKSELTALPATTSDRVREEEPAHAPGEASTDTDEKAAAPEPRLVRKPGFGGSAPLPVEPPQPDDPGVVDDEPEEEGECRSNAL